MRADFDHILAFGILLHAPYETSYKIIGLVLCLIYLFAQHCVSYTDAEGDPDHIGKRELILASP